MHPCPSCGAPLDNEGICLSCGALSRGFFRGLDLGTPQIAGAVARGLDFYRLLGVVPNAEVRPIARRYRQLRAMLFPDDPSGLEPEAARRLELLELSGRVLTDPRLRRIYDELRTSARPETTLTVLRCQGCAAPLPPDVARCPFCGTSRPPEAPAPSNPAEGSVPPATDPVDYYALLGLTPSHLVPPPSKIERMVDPITDGLFGILFEEDEPLPIPHRLSEPPSLSRIDMAALDRQRDILMSTGWAQAERDVRVEEIEIARRILRDDERRQ